MVLLALKIRDMTTGGIQASRFSAHNRICLLEPVWPVRHDNEKEDNQYAIIHVHCSLCSCDPSCYGVTNSSQGQQRHGLIEINPA